MCLSVAGADGNANVSLAPLECCRKQQLLISSKEAGVLCILGGDLPYGMENGGFLLRSFLKVSQGVSLGESPISLH